jgi:mannose-6-phosphate isomerase-like protein (cupin superfamily)
MSVRAEVETMRNIVAAIVLALGAFPSTASAQEGVAVFRHDELVRRDAALATNIGADGSSRETLADYGDHRFRFLRRASDGRPEQHDQIIDVVIVHSGRGTLLVGGRMVNPTGNATTGEYLGTAIEGGQRYELGPGDVVHIPAGLPHSFLVPASEHLTYVLVKFPAAEVAP